MRVLIMGVYKAKTLNVQCERTSEKNIVMGITAAPDMLLVYAGDY